MINVSEDAWNRYNDGLTKLNDITKGKVSDYIETHEVDSYEGRRALIDYCYALVTKYGEAAAELACQMYDAMSELEGANVEPAEPAELSTYEQVAKAVNGTMSNVLRFEVTAAAIARCVKLAGQDTTLKNAARDKAYFAWIPVGDTCPFCLAIAAEGWNIASEKAMSGGHAKHIHGNCNCSYAIKHKQDTNYKSYNPQKYQDIMSQAEGTTEEEKLNSIRRMEYDKNAAKIRAQKRSAYEKHKELESSEAEEVDVN